jgi:predicted amino acid racemase
VNLTCYGGVIPTKDNLGQLLEIHQHIKDKFGLKIELVSGGNSSSYYLFEENEFPKGINNLRMGEILVLGRETTYGNLVDGLQDDVFIFEAEIVELKDKPSIPTGKIGMDAFGNVPSFEDKGIRKRAILATGVQDVKPSDLMPVDEKLTLLGASSDHMIWDLSDSESDYKVGDVLRFKVSYGALLALYTSEYIYKYSF